MIYLLAISIIADVAIFCLAITFALEAWSMRRERLAREKGE